MKLAWSTVVLSLVVVGCADERAPTDDVGKGAPPPPPIASRCQGPAFCDGAACAPTTAAISEVACQCALLDPSCGTGVCIEGAYCEGFGCPNPVCYDVDSTISQAMCNGAALAGCALDCVAPAGEVALWPLDETATTAAYTVEWNPDDQSGGNRTQFAWAIQYVPPQRGVTALGFSAAWTGTWTGIAGTALRVELFDSATAAWTPVHTAAGPGPVSLADLQVGFAPLAVVTAIRFITIDVNTQLPVATVDFQNFVGGTFHLAQDVALRPKDLAGRNNGTALDTLQHHTASGSAGPVPAAGRARGALAFDGQGDVVIAPLHYDENSPGARATHNYGSVTASAWINLAQVTAPSRAVVAFTDRASGKIAYALEVTGSELTFRYRLYTASGALAGTFAQTTSGAGLTAGIWHHVAVTASNNGGVRYYVDGVQVATGTLALTGTMIGDQWQLGSSAGVGAPAPSFLGRIDEVKIYDRALPSGELLLAYNAGGGTCYPDVIVEVPHDGEVFEGANPNRTVAVAGHASSPGQQLAIEGHVGGASWTPLATAVASSTLDASGMYPWSTTITAPSSWPETGLGWIRATVWNQPLPAATVDDPLCLGRHAALGARDRVATCRGDHGPMVTLTDGDAVGQPIGSPALFPRSEPNPAGTLRYLWRKLYLGSSSGAQPVQPQPSAYYAAVGAGPSQPRSTMTGFLGVNGFPPVWPGAEIRARYFNAGDLRVGRDMHCREVTACDGTAPLCTTGSPACGVVVRRACYVTNYFASSFAPLAITAFAAGPGGPAGPAFADLQSGTNPRATVAMEALAFDPATFNCNVANPVPPTGAPPANWVRFYVYDPITNAVASQVALDSEGGRNVPGACLTCHGGQVTQHLGSQVVGSYFLPFDVGSFFFPTTPGLTYTSQEDDFRQLNQLVMATNPTPGIQELITGFYRRDDVSGAPLATAGLTVPGSTANIDFVPRGWAGHESTYTAVPRRSCRTCHLAQPFVQWPTFADFAQSGAIFAACPAPSPGPRPYMPQAEVPWKDLWRHGHRGDLVNATMAFDRCAP
jgi:hypothetical protein